MPSTKPPEHVPDPVSATLLFDDLLKTPIGKAVMKAAIDRVIDRYVREAFATVERVDHKAGLLEERLRSVEKHIKMLAPVKCDLCQRLKETVREFDDQD